VAIIEVNGKYLNIPLGGINLNILLYLFQESGRIPRAKDFSHPSLVNLREKESFGHLEKLYLASRIVTCKP